MAFWKSTVLAAVVEPNFSVPTRLVPEVPQLTDAVPLLILTVMGPAPPAKPPPLAVNWNLPEPEVPRVRVNVVVPLLWMTPPLRLRKLAAGKPTPLSACRAPAETVVPAV